MNSIGLCKWKKSGRGDLGTNFLALLSGCFIAPTRSRGLRRPKPPSLYFRLFHARQSVKLLLDRIPKFAYALITKLLAEARAVTNADFFVPISLLWVVCLKVY
jgi:hypothetical protein